MNSAWYQLGTLGVAVVVALPVAVLVGSAEPAAFLPAAPASQSGGSADEPARIFDHRQHVEEEEIDCTMCHLGAEDEERPGMPILNLCRLCHEKPEDEAEEDLAASLFDAEGRYAAEVFSALSDDIVFSHLQHVEVGMDCAECHGDMATNTSVDRSVAPRMNDCSACHVSRSQPNRCTTCHVDGGRALYGYHCTVCHGIEGRGDGPVADLLQPAPRDFGSGRFRLISTTNGVPTQGDLIATMRNGMPGSSMPPWEWLAEEDLSALALHVRGLAIEGQVADLLLWAEEEQEDLTEAEAREIALDKMTPGEPIHVGDVGASAPWDPVTLEEGRRLYEQMCASCHGEDGTGNAPVNRSGSLKNEDGTPSTARDFTAGIFKGGATHADIVRRLTGGLPGSPMPATNFESTAQAAAVAAYVRSLVKPGTPERVVQRRRTIPVAYLPEKVPTDPTDPAWDRVEGAWISLMPLSWRDQRVEGVVARALHDGETIAVHLSWQDPTQDDDLLGSSPINDAAAIQISVEADPPLFAMDAADHPVDVAFWRAAGEGKDTEGDHPGPSSAAPSAESSQSLRARASCAAALRTQGPRTVVPRSGVPSTWTVRGTWNEGSWDVVFSRSMTAGVEGEPPLPPGLSALLAFAVWDGSFGDRSGQKSVSVWNRLEIAVR